MEPLLRLLVVDDEALFGLALTRALRHLGCEISTVQTSMEALATLQTKPYDVMLLDLVMPDVGGSDGTARSQAGPPDIPAILITGRGHSEDSVIDAKLQIIDHLTKATPIPVLAERIVQLLAARSNGTQAYQTARPSNGLPVSGHAQATARAGGPARGPAERYVLQVPPIRLDLQRQLAVVEGDPERTCRLTPGETVLLATLMMFPNRVVSQDHLAQALTGSSVMADVTHRAVRHTVHRLRQKIEPDLHPPRLVQSVRGRGYVYATP